MSQQQALADIEIVIAGLTRALHSANRAKSAIITGHRARLEETITDLEDADLSVLVSRGIYDHLEELEELDPVGARADERVDRERVERAIAEAR